MYHLNLLRTPAHLNRRPIYDPALSHLQREIDDAPACRPAEWEDVDLASLLDRESLAANANRS